MARSLFRPIDHITAELVKLKHTPIPYLMIFCCCFVGAIAFLSHALDVHNVVKAGLNPWGKYFRGSMAIYSIFVLAPFIILTISGMAFIEQRANAWKYIYSNAVRRSHIYFYKLFMVLLILVAMVFVMTSILWLLTFILDAKFPEMEFSYYKPALNDFFLVNLHSIIAALGIVGIQFFLCMNFKNFMIPLGVGIFGFVLAFILMVAGSKYSIYLPYEYPMVVKDFGMVAYPFREDSFIPGLNNIEIYSIAYFLFFVILGYLLEIRKNIS